MGASQFDSAQVVAGVDTAWSGTYNLINGFFSGNQLDFNAPDQVAELNKLADPANYVCGASTFATDSWIPTVTSPTTISCRSSLSNTATGT